MMMSMMHRLYRRYIERAVVTSCSRGETGVEAVELAVRELPGVIIMDIMMPDMGRFFQQFERSRGTRRQKVFPSS
jgi:CheY-like chemotaxis protein